MALRYSLLLPYLNAHGARKLMVTCYCSPRNFGRCCHGASPDRHLTTAIRLPKIALAPQLPTLPHSCAPFHDPSRQYSIIFADFLLQA